LLNLHFYYYLISYPNQYNTVETHGRYDKNQVNLMHLTSSSKHAKHYTDSPFENAGADSLFSLQQFRWLSVFAMCLVTLFFDHLSPQDFSILPPLLVACATLLFNLIIMAMRHKDSHHRKPSLKQELIFDIISWITFLYFTGGAYYPLFSFLLPFVAIGATILPTYLAWTLGLLTVFVFSLLYEYHQHLPSYESLIPSDLHRFGQFVAFAASILVSLWFITRLAEAIRKCNYELQVTRESVRHNKWIVSLGGLAAGTAHELSTPLSTLNTIVEEMRSLPDPVYISQSDLALMQSQLMICRQSLTELTKKVSLSRDHVVEKIAIDVWLKRIIHTWQTFHPNAEIETTLDNNLSQRYLMPDLSLEQAVRNLVDNAIEAHPEGVILSANYNNGNLEITVYDRGPGIHQDILQHLELGLPQSSEKGFGLGLGLSLAKCAIEQHGGKMDFSNSPHGGTEVRVVLPLYEVSAT
jgi:two-component system sensor histidine kinase RegB